MNLNYSECEEFGIICTSGCDENDMTSPLSKKSPLRCDITSEQTPPAKQNYQLADECYPRIVRRAIDFSQYVSMPISQGIKATHLSEKAETDTTKELTCTSNIINRSVHEKQHKDVYTRLLDNELNESNIQNISALRFDNIHIDNRQSYQNMRNRSTTCTLFSTSPGIPYSFSNQKLLRTNIPEYRRIPKQPFKVLDAPGLPNDYYLNLLDWSKENLVAVALTDKVYLWEFASCRVTNLVSSTEANSVISCVRFCPERPNMLAYSTSNGYICLYDTLCQKIVKRGQVANGQRIGCLDWNGSLLTTGARDGSIRTIDLRLENNLVMTNSHGHNLEVCGLRWDPSNQVLASGGNDNRVFLWNLHQNIPIDNLLGHQGAVKALAWSPHEHGILASGGGSADRCIKFWTTKTPKLIESIDTQSQVCNLYWSATEKELVSTHGFSSNAINLWSYPNMKNLVSLKGHTSRVIYMAASPDGEKIVTGSGDETLRFWNVFSKNNEITNNHYADFRSYGTLR